MKVLLTGGAGFIGSHVLDTYLKDNHEVVVLDCLRGKRPNLPPKGVKLVKEDINQTNLKKLFADHAFDIVNHHAAQVNVRISIQDPPFDVQENVSVIVKLLHAATTSKKEITKFIFSSSGGAIYGDQSQYPTLESAQPKPESPYGISKWCGEHYLEYFAKQFGFKAVILRYANVYGPRQDPLGEAGVVSIFIDQMLKGNPSTIFGDGKQTRDFVFVGDVAEANRLALKGNVEGAFNVGTASETSVNEVYKYLKEICSQSKAANFGPPVKGELQRSCVDISKAKKILGWSPKVSIANGLQLTVDSFKK